MESLRQNEFIQTKIDILQDTLNELYQFHNNEKMRKYEQDLSIEAIDNLEDSIYFLKLLMEA